MATQAQANSFASDPRSFMRTAIVRWAGGAPQDQANITVAMLDDAGTGRRRTSVLGRKVDAEKFVLRQQAPGAVIPPAHRPFLRCGAVTSADRRAPPTCLLLAGRTSC